MVVKWNSGQSLVPFHINLSLTVRRDGQGHSQSSRMLSFYPLLLEPSMVKKKETNVSLLLSTKALVKDWYSDRFDDLGMKTLCIPVKVHETHGVTVEIQVTKNVHSGDGD